MNLKSNWNMLGHHWAVSLLKNNLARGRLRHAYLFAGPQGVGRRTLALRFAQAINCSQGAQKRDFCGECRSCKLFESMEHPDLSIVQAEVVGGNLKVDQIRELQHSLYLTPYEADFRIAIILRFEEANQNAANALLKTLEEPPSQVVLMLTAQEPAALLPTIVSRCELIRLRPMSITNLANELRDYCRIPDDQSKRLAHLSGGRPGYALKIQQEPGYLEKREAWVNEHNRLLTLNRVERFSYIEDIYQDKEQVEKILQVWSEVWRDILLLTSGSSTPLTNFDQLREIQSLANQIDSNRACIMLDAIDRTLTLIRKNVNTRLALEVLLLDLPVV
jgi:DNA polymerase-3 subunit delta'